jgi:general secretion pathway protein E
VVIGSARDRSPLWFALALLALGAAFVVLGFLPGPLTHRVETFFPDGPYRWAVLGVAVVLAVSLLLQGVAALLELGLGEPIPVLETTGASVEETLGEVRSQLAAVMARREPDVGAALDLLLQGALLLKGSDVHLNPLADGLNVNYRIQGVLHGVLTLPKELAPKFGQRVKVLANLDVFTRSPQDGVLRRTVGNHEVEARVSVLPTNHGERAVLRLVRGGEAITPLGDLGLDPAVVTELGAMLERPQGLILVSGPVGSGKTTTLYSALRYIHDARGETTSIMTLEDPIELQLPFSTQTQVNTKGGMSFAQGLRTVLRQDPGALMVGEIRDRETAQIAAQAGLTGHLILTTLHVDSAAGTFTRLMDMDVEPYVLSTAVVGALAQRLVRCLCVGCRRAEEPSAEEWRRFKEVGYELSAGPYYVPGACARCEGRGYDRRVPIAELLVVTDAVKEAIRTRRSSEEIHLLAVRSGMRPLVAQGLKLADRGETSLAEVLRVVG